MVGTEASTLEMLLLSRIERDLQRLGARLVRPRGILRTLRKALRAPQLTAEEESVVRQAQEAGEPRRVTLDRLLSTRISRAADAAAEAAAKEAGLKPPPPPGEVVVVREAGEAQEAVGELKESLAKKLTQAADSIRSRAGAASETDSSRVASAVVVLADEASHQNLRAVESVSVGETELSLCFEERQVIEAGEVSIGESGAVAVVEVGSDLRRLAARLADFLAFGKPRESPLAGDTDCLTGTILGGKYRVVRRIGKGGFGAVYEARDERIGSRVAIKLLNPGAARTAEDTRAFKDEARRLTRLDHPNIVDWKVFDEAEDGTCYFVMELLEGENLASVLKREGKLPVDRALNILLQVLDALRRAHHLSESESILHLDLKPKNVIVLPARAPGEAERVKVIDFGIGQYIGGAEEESSGGTPREVLDEATAYTSIRSERHRRTDCPDPGPAARSGRVRRASSCTPEYASPEQCAHMVEEGELLPLDGRSDLYSFGVMAFQMLAGRFPFDPPEADDRLEWLTIHREVPPQKMGSMGVRMPRELARFIDRCLVKDRDARWKNTPEAWQALHQIAHPPVWKQVARVAAPLLAVAALALWFYWPEAPAPPFSLYTMGDDLDLADQPLYLGPEKASVLLRAGDVELAGAGKLRIVAIDDGSTLEGWKAELRTDGQIVLSAPSPASDSPPGRFHRRVYVAEEGGKKPSLRSRDFELIYLGAESWHLATVEIAGLEGRALDPAGLQLDIWIMGEGRTDLHSVRVRQGGLSYTAPLDEIHARADTSLYRLPLDELRLASGEATLTIEATDRAGRTHLQEFPEDAPLRVIDEPLAILRATMDCNRIAERYSLSPKTRPTLSVELNREATLTVRVLDQEGRELAADSYRGRFGHNIPMEHLLRMKTGKPYTGTVEISADESSTVMHAEGSTRGRDDETLAFEYTDVHPDFTVRLSANGEQTGQVLALDEPCYTNQRQSTLFVTRKGRPIPIKIRIRSERIGEAQESTPQEGVLTDAAQRELGFPLRFAEDGAYRITVEVYRHDSDSEHVSAAPDEDRSYIVHVVTQIPEITLDGVGAGTVITPGDDSSPSLTLRIEREPGCPEGLETPVDLEWELLRIEDGEPVPITWSGLPERADPSHPEELELPDPWTGEDPTGDGLYRLRVTGRDLAGNDASLATLEWKVAMRGPELKLLEPALDLWSRDPVEDAWVVRVEARDANGVRAVRCHLRRAEGARTEGLDIPLRRTAESSRDITIWSGSGSLPHTWSEAQVRLELDAEDEHGTVSDHLSRVLRLPRIKRNPPALIRVDFEGHEIALMRLVRGNEEAPYTFGGRIEAEENRLFRQAGLYSYSSIDRPADSWQIEYAPREIEDCYLDEEEVTCSQYLAFLRVPAGYRNSAHWPQGSRAPGEERRGTLESRLSRTPHLPASGVSWEEAFAYARWAGKRLPSVVEWEYAVRAGAEYRPYPSWTREHATRPSPAEINYSPRVDGGGAPWPSPRGTDGTGRDVSRDGIWNLAGNVAEWTSTPVEFRAVDLPRGARHRDHIAYGRDHPAELLNPAVFPDWQRCEAYWVAGGSYKSSRFDFSTMNPWRRTWRDGAVGFRCAISASDVLAIMAGERSSPGRFEAVKE